MTPKYAEEITANLEQAETSIQAAPEVSHEKDFLFVARFVGSVDWLSDDARCNANGCTQSNANANPDTGALSHTGAA